MSAHDPLCPHLGEVDRCWICALIAEWLSASAVVPEVRAPASAPRDQPVPEDDLSIHDAKVRERLRAQVEALPDHRGRRGPTGLVLRSEVLALLDGAQ